MRRRDLRAVLAAFVASHRGLRAGHVFGAPAAFAGRRMFARLDGNGLQLRLPASFLEAKPSGPSARVSAGPAAPRPGLPRAKRAASSDWVTITSNSPAAARLEMLLEHAARHVALA